MAALTNDIYVGSVASPLYHFENTRMEMGSTKGIFALDVIGNELSIDQFTVVVRWTEDDFHYGFLTSDDEVFLTADDEAFLVRTVGNTQTDLKNFMRELPFGTPVWWYVDGSFYSKGYLKSVDRIAKNGFKVTCVSGVGLLDTDMHSGGLYQAAAITDVLASVIGGAFTYTVSQAVQNTARVYGRLPYDTRRNNLHRLLFATGAALQRGDNTTDYIIDYLGESVTDVPASRVALQGSVDYQLPSNRAEVTEHSFFYLSTSPTETLFDNTSETPAEGLTIVFDSPVYVASLATTGTLTVDEAGVNYAIVTGLGTLTGQYYVHTTQIDVLENNPNNDPIRVRRVTENELVTALNARNVQRRILSYYQSAKTVKAKILLDGERCGQLIRMTDAFGEITQAYLSRMDTLVTSVVGAQCQLIEGFQPGSGGNNFLHREAIIANGTWTVPNGVTFVRIALIGGGNGGQGGYDGERGADKIQSWPFYEGELVLVTEQPGHYFETIGYPNGEQREPAGGASGTPGGQSKVYVIERTVVPGEVITFAIGVGGQGGARNGGLGTNGTPTTALGASIGSVSSEDGVASQGYFDPFNGDVFAAQGTPGLQGGHGGRVDTINTYGWQGGGGLSGGDCGQQRGGAGGAGYIGSQYGGYDQTASGGGGGGAAYGANGNPGTDGYYKPHEYYEEGEQWMVTPAYYVTGRGGDGATALPPPKPSYGSGGGGGNGGGGGGNTGGGSCAGYDWSPATGVRLGGAGEGGQGSVGGDGGDGIALIYW